MVLGATVVFSVAASVILVSVLVGHDLSQASLWATVLGVPTGLVAAVAAWWAVAVRPSKALAPSALQLPEWVVGRSSEVEEVIGALLGRRSGMVGITTGLHGAGGFGKTTLAWMVCADRRVRRRFRGHVFLVTIGRDIRGAAAIAAKVNDVIKLVTGEDATFTDPELAGRWLGSVLSTGPRRLLVIDDVWQPEQLAPFIDGGRRCRRLVTTRIPALLAGRDVAVMVDQMSPEQARQVLTAGLPIMDESVAQGLLDVTGRWPLLLRLVNKVLANATRTSQDVSAPGMKLLKQLRAGGPAVVDHILGEASRSLEVDQPQQRARAVRATITASTSLLDPEDAERFAELGVFAEDETIPFRLVALLWEATAGLDELQAGQVCSRLNDLALVSSTEQYPGAIALHDVIRDFLRAELGPQRLTRLNGVLLDAVARALPEAGSLGPAADPDQAFVAWWALSDDQRYLWDHLIEHLLDANRLGVAEATATDLRWVGARLVKFGPAAPYADLALIRTTRAARMGAAIARAAHLLAPSEPALAVIDILHSRITTDPDWGPQVAALRDDSHRPRLVNRWPLPDLPAPAFRRALTSHAESVTAIIISPVGDWVATGSRDGAVRIWDAVSGEVRATLYGHQDEVTTMVISPDGTWLAIGNTAGVVSIWEIADEHERAILTGHEGEVTAIVISPDGSWLAVGSRDGTVRTWDSVSGHIRATLTGHQGGVTALAVSRDGSWLVAGFRDGTVRTWDSVSGHIRITLIGHPGEVTAVGISPDGSWLASSGADGTVRIWDATTGDIQDTLTGWIHTGRHKPSTGNAWSRKPRTVKPSSTASWELRSTGKWVPPARDESPVTGMVISPDGNWLAAGSRDGTIRIWGLADKHERVALVGHRYPVTAIVAAPDNSWVAAGSEDGTVRVVDAATGQVRADFTGHHYPVTAMAASPDSRWLATASSDGTVRIWDTPENYEQAASAGHQSSITAVVAAHDSSWLAAGEDDGVVKVLDAATGKVQAIFTERKGGVVALASAPDSDWLAVGSRDGKVLFLNAVTGQVRDTRPNHTGLAVASANGTVRIWDAALRALATLTDHQSGVTAVAASPDGTWLVRGSADGTVRIWDMVTRSDGRRLVADDNGSERGFKWAKATNHVRSARVDHQSGVTALAISPDGSWLASASLDGMVRIWGAASGRVRVTLTGHQGKVTAMAISRDGNWLATGGTDGTVRIWHAARGQACAIMRVESMILACDWLGANGTCRRRPGGPFTYLISFPVRTPSSEL